MTLIFPFFFNVIIPTDFHIFQRASSHQPALMALSIIYPDPMKISLVFASGGLQFHVSPPALLCGPSGFDAGRHRKRLRCSSADSTDPMGNHGKFGPFSGLDIRKSWEIMGNLN